MCSFHYGLCKGVYGYCVKVYMGWVASVNIRPNSRCSRVATILSGYSVSDRKDLAHFVLIYTIMVHF